MAQRVDVVWLDDLDGSAAAESVDFGLDGRRYEIDLSVENAAALRQVFAPFVAGARRRRGEVGARRARPVGAQRPAALATGDSVSASSTTVTGSTTSDDQTVAASPFTAKAPAVASPKPTQLVADPFRITPPLS